MLDFCKLIELAAGKGECAEAIDRRGEIADVVGGDLGGGDGAPMG